MKFQSAAIAALICAVTANPVPIEVPRLQERQDFNFTSNDLVDGLCRKVTFIFARGSLEAGNMVSLCPTMTGLMKYFADLTSRKGFFVGPPVCSDLQSLLGESNVSCQGVGSPYDGSITDNALPQNTSPQSIGAATTMFNLAYTQCPETLVVAGGYR